MKIQYKEKILMKKSDWIQNENSLLRLIDLIIRVPSIHDWEVLHIYISHMEWATLLLPLLLPHRFELLNLLYKCETLEKRYFCIEFIMTRFRLLLQINSYLKVNEIFNNNNTTSYKNNTLSQLPRLPIDCNLINKRKN